MRCGLVSRWSTRRQGALCVDHSFEEHDIFFVRCQQGPMILTPDIVIHAPLVAVSCYCHTTLDITCSTDDLHLENLGLARREREFVPGRQSKCCRRVFVALPETATGKKKRQNKCRVQDFGRI